MIGILMALGPFRFQVSGPSYERFSHRSEARWEKQERLGREPALQFMGPGGHRISLDGTIYTQYTGGYAQIERMREAMAKGAPFILVSGFGKVFGKFVIEGVDTGQEYFLPDGSPLKVEFTVDLASYGDDRGGIGGLF